MPVRISVTDKTAISFVTVGTEPSVITQLACVFAQRGGEDHSVKKSVKLESMERSVCRTVAVAMVEFVTIVQGNALVVQGGLETIVILVW
uniref:Uncharacterized protein n=1 Tax=Sphaerodactylus townsendi TaxID=933632 RepID=A0ACB8FBG0_9SAUR